MLIPDKKIFWLNLIAVCVIAYFTIFNQIERLSLRWWDEASYALNAQEMLEHKNPIVIYLNGAPDKYNSKPPFAIWCMSACVKIFGLNELGIRFASAIFAFLTVLLLYIFLSKVFNNSPGGLMAAIILCSSSGYMGEHIARTGDTDAILSFWILAYTCSFILFVLSSNIKIRNISFLLTSIFVSLACLTKGVSGLTAIPGLFAWVVINKKTKELFINRYFYIGLSIFILLVPGYYFLRESLDPGYLSEVLKNEIGGRIQQQEYINPQHLPFYTYYSRMIFENRFMPWILLLPLAIASIVLSKKSALKTSALIVIYSIISISLILSLSQTKTPWYDAPLYPLFSLVIGMAFVLFFQNISEISTEISSKIMIVGIILALCVLPIVNIINEHIQKENDVHVREFFYHYRIEKHQTEKITAINSDPYFPLVVYLKKDLLNGFNNCQKKPNDTTLRINDLVFTFKAEREADLSNRYVMDTLDMYYECKLFRIKKLNR